MYLLILDKDFEFIIEDILCSIQDGTSAAMQLIHIIVNPSLDRLCGSVASTTLYLECSVFKSWPGDRLS
jgi:hypothetical protein